MVLLLDPLIYTSFPTIGFKLLASRTVSESLQKAFLNLVHQYWDAYNPPRSGFRAAYLHQPSSENCLFGWLFNEGTDDLGRTSVPYFHCYCLSEPLQPARLVQILTCLRKGPIAAIGTPSSLESFSVPDLYSYQPVRRGVAISADIWEQCHQLLLKGKLLDIFVPDEEQSLETELGSRSELQSNQVTLQLPPSQTTRRTMSNTIEDVLRELISKPIGIQGVVLVSPEGQLVTAPIGMNENTALIMAGTMLYLAKSACEEFGWQDIEKISVRAPEGQILLAPCSHEVFLLVKAGKALTGLLEGEINRTLKKLQTSIAIKEDTKLQAQTVELEAEIMTEGRSEDYLNRPPQSQMIDAQPSSGMQRRYRGITY